MKINEAVKKIISEEHTTQTDLCKQMGMPFTTLNTTLRRDSMTTDKLIRILDALGYEMVLRPKKGTKIAERSVIVDERGDTQ